MTERIWRGIPRNPAASADVQAITTNVEKGLGFAGDGRDKWLTIRDLEDAGIIETIQQNIGGRNTYTPVPPGGTNPDAQTPTQPQNFEVNAGFQVIILQWDAPTYSGHAYTEIYRSLTDNFSQAVRVQTSIPNIAANIVDYGQAFYYWVRFVNVNGIKGPLNDTAGTFAQAAPNVTAVIEQLSDEINATHLAQELRSRIDLIDTPDTGLIDLLQAEVDARLADVTNLVSSISAETAARLADILAANGRIDGNDSDIVAIQADIVQIEADLGDTASSSAVQALETRISQNETTITSQSTAITALNSDVSAANSNISGNASAINSLDTRVTDNEGNISTQSTQITQLQSSVTTANTNISGNASAISALDTRVTTAEGSITSQSAAITQIQADINDLENGGSGSAAAINALDVRVTANEDDITSQSTSITSLQSSVANANTSISGNSSAIGSLDSRVVATESDIASQASQLTSLSTDVTNAQNTANAASSAASALDSRVTANESSISSQSSQLTTLSNEIDSVETTANATASAVSALESEVTANENSITSLTSSVTSLQNSISGLDGDITANSNAITSLNSSVTSLGNDVTAQAQDITQLSTTVGGNTSTIQTQAISLNGLTAQWDVKTDVNGRVGGVGFYNDGTTTSFLVNADVFALLDPSGDAVNPFFVTGGDVYINSAFIANGTIQNAQIQSLVVDKVTGLDANFVLATIGVGNIDNAYIGNIIQSNVFNSTTGWRIDKNGQIDARSITIRDSSGNVVLSSGTGLEWSFVSGSGRPEDGADVTGDHRNETFSDNLVVDGDMELSSSSYWDDISGSGSRGKATNQVYSGTRSLFAAPSNNSAFFIGQSERETINPLLVPIEDRETLFLSVWARTGSSNSAQIGVRLYNANGGTTSEDYSPSVTTSGAWQQLTYSVSTFGSRFAQIVLRVNNSSFQFVHFDRAIMRKSPITPVVGEHNPISSGNIGSVVTAPIVGGHNPIGPANVSTFMQSAAIDTLYVAGQAITATEIAENNSAFSVVSPTSTANGAFSGWFTGVSRSITISNAVATTVVGISISIQERVLNSGGNGTVFYELQVLRSGLEVGRIFLTLGTGDPGNTYVSRLSSALITDTPTNGTSTYQVRLRAVRTQSGNSTTTLEVSRVAVSLDLRKR